MVSLLNEKQLTDCQHLDLFSEQLAFYGQAPPHWQTAVRCNVACKEWDSIEAVAHLSYLRG